jgi:protein-S-isoprenylcysteine O-methyltransferase Ste14
MRKYIAALYLLLFTAGTSFAQSGSGIEMADEMRSSGKIYVVVAVIILILLALIAYLFTIDRKIKKLEQKN